MMVRELSFVPRNQEVSISLFLFVLRCPFIIIVIVALASPQRVTSRVMLM